MSISRVAGQMLQTILERDGVDISFANANVGINTSTPSSEFEVVGNITVGNILIPNVGNVSVGNVNINNLAEPYANADAATKNYVDSSIGNISFDISDGSNTQTILSDGETITFSGTANQIDVVVGSVDTVTFSLPSTIAINSITSLASNGNLTIAANGSGNVVVNSPLVTGNITSGNIRVGNILIPSLGNIDAGNVAISNLANPSGNQDATTKYYVDQLVGNGVSNIGNLTVSNTTITTSLTDGNITLLSTGNGLAQVGGNVGFGVPVGNTLQRPVSPTTGTLRFNTTTVQLEIWDGAEWDSASGTVSTISNETFYGDGSTVDFTLGQEATSDGVIVTLNGLQQAPSTAYVVSSTTLTFTEAPQTGDVIQVRFIASTKTITAITNTGGNAVVRANDTAPTVEITGNLVPTSNVTYSLGNSTNYWNNLYLSGNTIYLGPLQLKAINSTTFAVYQSDGSTQANIDVGSIDVSGITNGTTNISIPTTNGNANISVGGTSNVLIVTSTGSNITGYVNATGNITGGNLITTGLVSSTNLTGTLTTAAQPNITSVGTLSSLSVTANVTSGNVNTAGQVVATGNITGGNIKTSGITISGTTVSGATTVSATNLTGTLTTAAQPNITSVGTLSSLSVTGNITGGNLITSGLVSTSSITKTGSNAVGNIGSSNNYFDIVFATSTSALYADLAEMYLADQMYEPGTVLSFGGLAEVTCSSNDQDTAVAGIVSTQPAYRMNSGLTGDHVVALALIGRVPCRVKGPVRPGSLLVSTNDGYARAETNPKPGTIIAKAIESFDGETGIIEVVVGRT
jgi:hypothetical protein